MFWYKSPSHDKRTYTSVFFVFFSQSSSRLFCYWEKILIESFYSAYIHVARIYVSFNCRFVSSLGQKTRKNSSLVWLADFRKKNLFKMCFITSLDILNYKKVLFIIILCCRADRSSPDPDLHNSVWTVHWILKFDRKFGFLIFQN